jgi:hypothetical protein
MTKTSTKLISKKIIQNLIPKLLKSVYAIENMHISEPPMGIKLLLHDVIQNR